MARLARGFTLIEMALVVLVLGVVTAGTIGVVAPLRDNERAAATNKRLDVAQKAIALYAIRNGCLPCPGNPDARSTVAADNAGRALDTGGIYTDPTTYCTAAACAATTGDTGVLPWIELGLSEDDATDGWGNRLRYAVAGASAVAATCGTAGTLQQPGGLMRLSGSGGCYPQGNLTVNNTDPPATTIGPANGAAYVVLSNGADQALAHRAGTGAATGDRWTQTTGGQFNNSNGGTAYTTGTTNDSTNDTHFDDLVRYTTAPIIIQLCGAGACGNPS